MSSFKRIPKNFVKKGDNTFSINDKYSKETGNFKNTMVDEHMEESLKKIKEKEKMMLEDIEANKDALIEKAYSEGMQKAIEEVEIKNKAKYEEILDEAKSFYHKANEHFQTIIEESDKMKEHYLTEKKAEVIDFILYMVKKITNEELSIDEAKIETIYNQTLKEVSYETKKIYVRMHPDSRKFIMQINDEGLDKRIEILSEPTLGRADVIIETEREVIDKTIDAQLDEVKELLRGAMND